MPPVCKILNYGKYRYQIQKNQHDARKKQKISTVELKELKLRPTIEENDYQVKLKNAKKFLSAGNKVKFSLRFRGREMIHKDIGFKVLDRMKNDLELEARIELEPKIEGFLALMIVAPIK